eukprot:1947970-Pleurochrysis_carterae.AAC.2
MARFTSGRMYTRVKRCCRVRRACCLACCLLALGVFGATCAAELGLRSATQMRRQQRRHTCVR